jgi:hypothetical protein
VIISGRMRWAGHVACIGERRGSDREIQGRIRLEDLDVDSRIVLKWIFKN